MICTVFYEDKHAPQSKTFAPHELVLSCVQDRLQGAGFQLQRRRLTNEIVCKACGGDSNLRKELQQNGRRVAQSGAVFALFDEDKIRELLKMNRTTAVRSILAELGKQTGAVPGVRFVLLVRNMEDVVNACRQTRKQPPLPGKPTPAERDREIAPLIYGPEADRASVLSAIPSLECLVDQLALWLALVECHEGRC